MAKTTYEGIDQIAEALVQAFEANQQSVPKDVIRSTLDCLLPENELARLNVALDDKAISTIVNKMNKLPSSTSPIEEQAALLKNVLEHAMSIPPSEKPALRDAARQALLDRFFEENPRPKGDAINIVCNLGEENAKGFLMDYLAERPEFHTFKADLAEFYKKQTVIIGELNGIEKQLAYDWHRAKEVAPEQMRLPPWNRFLEQEPTERQTLIEQYGTDTETGQRLKQCLDHAQAHDAKRLEQAALEHPKLPPVFYRRDTLPLIQYLSDTAMKPVVQGTQAQNKVELENITEGQLRETEALLRSNYEERLVLVDALSAIGTDFKSENWNSDAMSKAIEKLKKQISEDDPAHNLLQELKQNLESGKRLGDRLYVVDPERALEIMGDGRKTAGSLYAEMEAAHTPVWHTHADALPPKSTTPDNVRAAPEELAAIEPLPATPTPPEDTAPVSTAAEAEPTGVLEPEASPPVEEQAPPLEEMEPAEQPPVIETQAEEPLPQPPDIVVEQPPASIESSPRADIPAPPTDEIVEATELEAPAEQAETEVVKAPESTPEDHTETKDEVGEPEVVNTEPPKPSKTEPKPEPKAEEGLFNIFRKGGKAAGELSATRIGGAVAGLAALGGIGYLLTRKEEPDQTPEPYISDAEDKGKMLNANEQQLGQ